MTPERYLEITRLYQAALELNASQRAAFLAQACAANDELRKEIEELLAMDAAEDSFIDQPALQVAAQIFASEQPQVQLGQRVGPYQLVNFLGAGGMGQVYLAQDVRLKRQVALKVLPLAFTKDEDRVRRFEQEAQAASALNHPNILTIYDFGQIELGQRGEGLHYLATEYVEGQTLRQLLQTGPLPLPQVLEIALQLTDALAAAHQAGIIHRDLKPENVMRRPDGYVKLLDFGLAKLLERNEDAREKEHAENPPSLFSSSAIPHPLTQPGRVMGTISYLSPEQARGQDVDGRADIFSLGLVLYELLTGKQPFKGDSEAATYNAILNHPPPALTQIRPDVPPEFAAIVERALEKDSALRYQSAADLRAALKHWQQDFASNSASRASATPSRFKQRQRLGWLAVTLLGVTALGVGLARGWWSPQQSNKPLTPTLTPVLPSNVSFSQQTDQAGVEYFPALSPDGKTLVYASQHSGNWDLWRQTVGQRVRVNLTADWPGEDTQPAFAPTGEKLVFRSSRDGGGLFTLDLASRAVKKIVGEGFNPAWSADGTEIVYATVGITNVEGRALSQLWVVQLATGEKRLLIGQDGVQPAWSPHGQRIAFWGENQNSRADLWSVSANGGAAVRITNDASTDWNPCWSADGRYLYFTSDRGGSMNLWRVPLDEISGRVLGAPEPATTPASDMLQLSIARTGRQMAYVQRTKLRRLQALPFDPTRGTAHGTPRFITQGTGFATHPSLSPDGQWLAYSSSGSSQEDLYVIRTDGTGLRQLTNDQAKDRLPRWSPDGQRIAFFSDREKKNEIWTIAPDGTGTAKQFTFVGNGRAVFPTWSPDAHWLAYYFFGQGSFIADTQKTWEQQTPQPIGSLGQLEAGLGVWAWSPDGAKLACIQFGAGRQQSSVRVYWLATAKSAPHLETIVEEGDYPAWLSDNRRLLYTLAGKLYLTDLTTKTPRLVFTPSPDEAAEYPTLARDNRTIYFSLSSTEADVWLINHFSD